jgi:hypothetical protein
MRHPLRACMMTLAFLGSTGLALAQAPSTQAPPAQAPRAQTPAVQSPLSTPGAQTKLQLSQQQKQQIGQALSGEQTQQAAGAQAQVGSKLPASMTTHPMPGSVTAQVPATKDFHFVKLQDRVLIVDPKDQMIAEVIQVPSTTGAGNPASPAPGGPR